MAFTEKYVTNSGAGAADGSSLANAWSWATMLTTLAAGQRANVQGAITRTTSVDTFTNAGTAANPMAIRGINSTLDDLEANGRTRGGALVTTNFPVVTYTTGRLTLPNFCQVEHMSFTGTPTTQTLATGTNNMLRRLTAANTAASGTVGAVNLGSNVAIDCDFSCASSASNSRCVTVSSSSTIDGCLLFGTGSFGGLAVSTSSAGATICRSMIRDCVAGIGGSGTLVTMYGNSFRNCSGLHVNVSSLKMSYNNVAWGSGGGSSQWYASGGTVVQNGQFNNFVGNMGVADADLGNWINRNGVTLTADPFTSSTDLTLNNTSGGGALVRAAGYPAYLDGGAWQHQDAGGGSGLLVVPGLFGGFARSN